MDDNQRAEFMEMAITQLPRHFIGVASSCNDGIVFDENGSDLLVLHDPIFQFDIIIACGDLKWCFMVQSSIFPDALKESRNETVAGTVGASCYTDDPEKLGMIRMDHFGWHLLAHESNHMACWVAEFVNIKHSNDSEEFFCYYQQWIVGAVEYMRDLQLSRNDEFVKLFPLTTEEAVA